MEKLLIKKCKYSSITISIEKAINPSASRMTGDFAEVVYITFKSNITDINKTIRICTNTLSLWYKMLIEPVINLMKYEDEMDLNQVFLYFMLIKHEFPKNTYKLVFGENTMESMKNVIGINKAIQTVSSRKRVKDVYGKSLKVSDLVTYNSITSLLGVGYIRVMNNLLKPLSNGNLISTIYTNSINTKYNCKMLIIVRELKMLNCTISYEIALANSNIFDDELGGYNNAFEYITNITANKFSDKIMFNILHTYFGEIKTNALVDSLVNVFKDIASNSEKYNKDTFGYERDEEELVVYNKYIDIFKEIMVEKYKTDKDVLHFLYDNIFDKEDIID